ncbi:GNAT family N-acetyltransferase [Streptomyces himalayensis]|uniref:GNAT family N-acetyltransferase n=1 Tax=Streptomyces himalayensis subsp. himalayensis TaxID=2756131 RepID=A0A7W0IB43_9ACTN|nr:GNAT family N-acetyltransferase [Streptomyces himalayensis]MBA2948786.1 GNAT family N-acetyltransferase [Streptomyces himalayensis subsp. himalayensis]
MTDATGTTAHRITGTTPHSPAKADTAQGPWTVAPEAFDSPVAVALWRAYYTEVSDRWYELHEGRSTPPDELEREIAADPGSDFVPPRGVLLVARYDGEPAGMAGMRLLDASTGELKRFFVRREMRGKGGAALLLAAAEDAARALGADRVVLDTRHDLVEARALYARHGYEEIEAYNASAYAEHWFSKRLAAEG